MIKLEDRKTWPKIGSKWKHYNGLIYKVVQFTNIETNNQDKYPTTIIYNNAENLKLYSRPLIDWDRSMEELLQGK